MGVSFFRLFSTLGHVRLGYIVLGHHRHRGSIGKKITPPLFLIYFENKGEGVGLLKVHCVGKQRNF